MNLKYIPPWLVIILALIYLVSPFDILPDIFGLPGRLDDIFAVLLGLWLYYRLSQIKRYGKGYQYGYKTNTGSSRKKTGQYKEEAKTGTANDHGDPYEVIGVSKDADIGEIRKAYREKLKQYHPDRVQHLGKEFQEMAEKKTKIINEAFYKILKERGLV